MTLNQARKTLPNTGVAPSHLLEAFGLLMLSLGLLVPSRRKQTGKLAKFDIKKEALPHVG
ncbi:LPXTG cell wall anchor domain-containing protein [Weissella viridescens]|uniref:LPXTG cell wall anchor domain-containing protein n=1 Tax=Weissella viridescens TaxID=1629 RepID=UPI00163A7834|nr:LPXTG cell wall anchor domain-containing protein [Weissella viridescens]